MNKRFIAMFLAMLMCLVCALSFVACVEPNTPDANPDAEVKVEQVTEEEWKAAFEATCSAENFTLYLDIGGTINEDRYSEKIGQFWNYKVDNNKVFGNTMEYFGQEGDCSDAYLIIEDNTEWCVEREYTKGSTDYGEWNCRDSNFQDEEVGRFIINSTLNYFFTVNKNGRCYGLDELYSEFIYKDGYYTAELNMILPGVSPNGTPGMCNVAIKNGHITEITYKNSNSIENLYCLLTIKDYGSTTITIPSEVLAAIEKAKQEG